MFLELPEEKNHWRLYKMHTFECRFNQTPGNTSPGPGQYSLASDTSDEVAKNKFGRNATFGTTAARFKDSMKETQDKELPGPGTYTEKQRVVPVRQVPNISRIHFRTYIVQQKSHEECRQRAYSCRSLMHALWTNLQKQATFLHIWIHVNLCINLK